jgi:hypothetical protein
LALAKKTQNDPTPSEYWLQYGIWTRVNSNRAEIYVGRFMVGADAVEDSESRVFRVARRALLGEPRSAKSP